MSYFPDMFKPVGGLKAWLMHVGKHGITVYSLDSDGKPEAMTSGSAKEAIGEPLTVAFPNLFVAEIGSPHWSPEQPWSWGFDWDWTWNDVASILNGKSSSRRSRAQGAKRALARLRAPLETYLLINDDGSYVLTSAALAADEKALAKEAAANVTA